MDGKGWCLLVNSFLGAVTASPLHSWHVPGPIRSFFCCVAEANPFLSVRCALSCLPSLQPKATFSFRIDDFFTSHSSVSLPIHMPVSAELCNTPRGVGQALCHIFFLLLWCQAAEPRTGML